MLTIYCREVFNICNLWFCCTPRPPPLADLLVMQDCGLNYTTVEACGFGTTEASCHNYTVSDFCQANPYAERYDGGLTGAPAGLFSYFNLALYWAPSSCRQAALDDPLHLWCSFSKTHQTPTMSIQVKLLKQNGFQAFSKSLGLSWGSILSTEHQDVLQCTCTCNAPASGVQRLPASRQAIKPLETAHIRSSTQRVSPALKAQ